MFVLGCAGASLLAQQPPAITAPPAIRGRVLAAADGAPLRRARIDVVAGGQHVGSVFTDDAGGFSVDTVGPGPFVVTVAKGGYATARTTRSRAEVASSLTVRLSRGAVIAGRVELAGGMPAVGSTITARRLDDETPGVPQAFSTSTDDLGAYRLGGLPAGRFDLTAGPPPQSIPVQATAEGFVVQGAQPVNESMRTSRDVAMGATVIVQGTPPLRTIDVVSANGTLVRRTAPPPPLPSRVVTLGVGEEVRGIDFSVAAEDSLEKRMLAELGVAIVSPAARVYPPGAAAGIRGRVTGADGQPIRDARVQLSGVLVPLTGSSPQQVWTDADGRYVLMGLRAGNYTVQVSRPGFAAASFGQQGAIEGGRTITLATDQVADDVDIVLPRGIAVSGVVLDDRGEPLQGASVYAVQLRQVEGRVAALFAGSPRRTDDGGRYRLFNLRPGTYVVATSVEGVVSGATDTGYAPIYFPGTPLIDTATPLSLSADSDGVNFVFTRSRAPRVRGTAFEGDTPLLAGTARLVVSRRSNAIVFDLPSATIRSDGTFTFPNVPPGEYVVQVRGDGPGRTGMFGVAHVSVADADPPPVAVRASHGASVEGRFVIEGQTEPGPPSAFTIAPVALDPDRVRPENTSSFVVSSQGTFYVSSLFGPTALVLRRAPSDSWFLKSVIVGGLDVTDAGFEVPAGAITLPDAEIVVSSTGATVTGTAADGNAPVEDYSVVAFPVLRDQWTPHSRRLRFARSSRGGRFRLAGLPPGDYYVAAVDRLEGTPGGGEWQSADVLSRLAPLAERITLKEGESRAATLRLVRR